MRNAILLLATTLLAASSFNDRAAHWREHYESSLKAPDGWLAVAGLFWLREGANTVGSDPKSDVALPASAPKHAGTLTLHDKKVAWAPATGQKTDLKNDTSGKATVVQISDLTFTIIEREGKSGVRLRDPNAETRRDFTGTHWFPPSDNWVVKAKWTPYPAGRTIPITNILGMTDNEPSPGYAEFTVQGKTVRLDPVTEDDQLFFMFKDSTTGKSTYPAGRFVYSSMPKDGVVEIDFNQTHNPPCAFTAFATCPLPPRQNTLPVAVEAGEKNYGHH
jgi:uncharacterized protein (DUF1684 family)